MTAAEVITEAIPHSQTDTELFSRFIFPAQIKYLRKALGKDYYEELDGEIANATLTVDNSALLNDWIKPALAYFVAHDAASQARTEFTSQGFIQNITQTGDSASDKAYAETKNGLLAQAQALLNAMDIYICELQDDDSSKYTEYCPKEKNMESTNIVFYDTKKRESRYTDEDFE